jgi:hypothetical protein
MELTQARADEYLAVKKRFLLNPEINLNQPFKITEPLVSDEHGDIFKLDLRQGRMELKMVNLNTRANECFVLCRLDIDDRMHKNPDNKKINEPHIHFYKEGFGDKFAFPAKDYGFSNFDNILENIKRFFSFCNIDTTKISIQGRL